MNELDIKWKSLESIAKHVFKHKQANHAVFLEKYFHIFPYQLQNEIDWKFYWKPNNECKKASDEWFNIIKKIKFSSTFAHAILLHYSPMSTALHCRFDLDFMFAYIHMQIDLSSIFCASLLLSTQLFMSVFGA